LKSEITSTMRNQAMYRKLKSGRAIDISRCPRTAAGDYVLNEFVEGKNYCDARQDTWIWSIAKILRPLPSVMADGSRITLQPGTYLASKEQRFYHGQQSTSAYECVYLR
jgi:hypothetical protein